MASRFAPPSGSLASGYPLHHPHHGFAVLRVVSLLSLSHSRPEAACAAVGRGGFAAFSTNLWRRLVEPQRGDIFIAI